MAREPSLIALLSLSLIHLSSILIILVSDSPFLCPLILPTSPFQIDSYLLSSDHPGKGGSVNQFSLTDPC
jgi:hypothetical protein